MSDEQPIPPDQLNPTEPAAPRPRKKMGRPRAEIDWQVFDGLCFAHCTLAEIACYFEVNESTIERAVKREFGETFADIFAHKSARAKVSLRRAQWDSALRRRDSRMMIWLGKQHLGQREVIEMDVAERYPITPEIEVKDRNTLEREIASFFAGIDLTARIRKAEAQARTERQAPKDQTKSWPEPSAVTQPGPPASQGGSWPTRQDLIALRAAEESERRKG